MNKTVFVGMSGGVDSSVTAGILKGQGYNVVGVHLRCWNVDGCAEQDAEDARRAAETLGIPFYVFDFEKEYRQKVVDYMVDGYRKGITPNPDVMCNHEIKFGMFFKRAMELGADYVATGHYVKLTNGKLYAAKDESKDQSYFLWMLTPRQIAKCLFPLGDLIKKTDVRRLAKKYKLPNAEKKDSQGVCFLGQISLPEFLDNFIPAKKGKVLTTAGAVVGEHTGAHHFTIGQRRGIGVGGFSQPMYVSAKDIKKNTIVIAPEDDEALYATKVTLSDLNFIGTKTSGGVYARVRYRQPVFSAKLEGKTLTFKKPEKFIAPGQSAVFYAKNGQMLGGGIIAKAG
jgi:tRNA-uridine 2-sulfurtransferase